MASIRFFRSRRAATAGDNRLYIDMPYPSVLRHVALKNHNLAWQYEAAVLVNRSAAIDTAESIGLLGAIQCGTVASVFQSDFAIAIGEELSRIIGFFHNCVAGDDIALTVGVEL